VSQGSIGGTSQPTQTFRHEALLYAGGRGFLDRTAPFILGAVAKREPILVVVSTAKIDMLRAELGSAADRVAFADMEMVGLNPARIIPAWREFLVQNGDAGRGCRGLGEPIWAGRTPEELVECERHEALLNLAFDEGPPLWLACPYDTLALDPAVIEEAHRTHPLVWDGGDAHDVSDVFPGLAAVAGPFDRPLSEPEEPTGEIAFGLADLPMVRASVERAAADGGLSSSRTEDLILAASEVATNSVRHGGGGGRLRIWRSGDALVCEVRDSGRLDQPLAGREKPADEQGSGFGLWLANQVCDLVQIRSFEAGTVVRLFMARG
jgi:anti-sigma regulatory factor (Ser/Thr protein kinase)